MLSSQPDHGGWATAGNDVFMDTLKALHTRTSVPKLTDPGPDRETLDNIFKAAFRAADHGVLRPWRFLKIEGASRNRLGDLFAQAMAADNPDVGPEKLTSLRRKPLRAPLILVCISCIKEHPKVPEIEQDMSTAAATQNMLLAAFAQGLGAMWRTGSMAYNDTVKQGLGLKPNEKIIGFLYLGRIEGAIKNISEPRIEDFVQNW